MGTNARRLKFHNSYPAHCYLSMMVLPSSLPGTSQVESKAVVANLRCVHRLLNTPLGVTQGLCGIIRYVSHALKERSLTVISLDSQVVSLGMAMSGNYQGMSPLLSDTVV